MFGCLVCKAEQRGCDAFGLIPSPPAFLAAGCLPRSAAQLWVSMTGLDDLDNAASEEDDSCQGSVKLAFLPPVFFFFLPHWALFPGRKLWVVTLRFSCEHLLLVYLRAAHLFFYCQARRKTFFFLDSIFNGSGGSKMNKQRGGNSAHGK